MCLNVACLRSIHAFSIFFFQILSKIRFSNLYHAVVRFCLVTSCFILKCHSPPVSGHLLFPHSHLSACPPWFLNVSICSPLSSGIYNLHPLSPVVPLSYSAKTILNFLRVYPQFLQPFLFLCFGSDYYLTPSGEIFSLKVFSLFTSSHCQEADWFC